MRVKVAHMGGQVREIGGQNLLTREHHFPFGGDQNPFKRALHLFLLSSRAKQRQWELLRESHDLAHFLARTWLLPPQSK